ncbi:MAG: glycosyltransferase family 2 protein [Methanobacterium sp.]
MDQEPEFSVIILNYKNADLTAKCVDYLMKASDEAKIDIETIIVDNSAKQTARMLEKLLPEKVKIIPNQENLGFSKANNQGISVSRGKYVLLLNNDAFVNNDVLRTGIRFLDENPDCGIWAPRLEGEDGTYQMTSARLPSLKGLIIEYLLFRSYDRYADSESWEEPRKVDAVIGAFMLIPRRVIETIGMLDEDFFFTVEDIDYCFRVNKANFKVYYDPTVSMVHLVSASQKEGIEYPELHTNRVLYFKKNKGIIQGFLSAIIINLGLFLRKILL